jgi:hypothetical protein
MAEPQSERLALFLELAIEATAIADSIGDGLLSTLAASAALQAGEQLGLSDGTIARLRRDVRKRLMAAPPGTRLSPDLAGRPGAEAPTASPDGNGRASRHTETRPRQHRAKRRVETPARVRGLVGSC